MSDLNKEMFPYLHGFSEDEQLRLRRQARFMEHIIYKDIDFSRCKNVIEVGSGVGAQTDILLRRFPDLKVIGIDLNDKQLASARKYFSTKEELSSRCEFLEMNAESLSFESDSFDGGFLCWVLEHVPNPESIVHSCAKLTKPGGWTFFSTLNRNPKSYLLAVVGAEYVLNLLPRGTHDYIKFIKPSELARMARRTGLEMEGITGMTYNPFTKVYSLGKDSSVNYIMVYRA